MRQGCISLGEIHCDGCHRIIPYLEQYLTISEEDGVEVEKGKTLRYCLNCCLEKKYAYYREEKGEQILTFFPEFPQQAINSSVESGEDIS